MVAALYARGGELTVDFACYLEGGCHEETQLDGLSGDCLDRGLLD
jgi:hypothetical protein